MEYRSLGRTGVQVSALCLGGMLFGAQTDEAEAYALMDRALDAGLNFLDTANIYNRARSEEVIGRALRRDGRRARSGCTGWCASSRRIICWTGGSSGSWSPWPRPTAWPCCRGPPWPGVF
jgi:Aldo/keto reductase family